MAILSSDGHYPIISLLHYLSGNNMNTTCIEPISWKGNIMSNEYYLHSGEGDNT